MQEQTYLQYSEVKPQPFKASFSPKERTVFYAAVRNWFRKAALENYQSERYNQTVKKNQGTAHKILLRRQFQTPRGAQPSEQHRAAGLCLQPAQTSPAAVFSTILPQLLLRATVFFSRTHQKLFLCKSPPCDKSYLIPHKLHFPITCVKVHRCTRILSNNEY